ncbi:mediator of RNA polymerase II transcription subunit 12-like protein [Haliotis asinina]|uniref:mediator of RNA polymerase II transcription subunit 12-like protein n=1 Tax=Haliotis asinina TaxID=109174 RepID=UPI00353233C4
MAASHPSEEHRPLKKPRLGPPDVYPQVPKQKEDELDQASVKHGFSNQSSFSDEYGSERNADINLDKFGTQFSSIITKKMEINTLQDSKKRQQPPMKDNFWPAARNKIAMEAWFKDLAGNKPLAHLSKKVPTFNKKEETFTTLCDFAVPMVRAAWYIKITTAHNMASNETRRKKQAPDLSLAWTQAITKFLYEQLQKIQDAYSGCGAPQTSFLTATQPPAQVDLEPALKHFHYTCRLAKHKFNEGLLDHQEFLNWLIELLDKIKQNDDTVLKLILAQIVQYLDEVTLSALLSRKLAYFCSRKLAQLCSESGCTSPRTQSPMLTTNGNGAITTTSTNQYISSPMAVMFAELSGCPQHRSLILNLSAILQRLTLKCPTGIVWNNLGEGKITSFLCGSPLDYLACAPSSLPMLPGPHNQQIRAQIRASEHQIKLRGKGAEVRWSSDKCQQSAKGFVISKVLHVLDNLDKHHFDKVDINNSHDVLYQKIFSINQTKDGNEPMLGDEPIIKLLIDWAVTTQRTGDHRAVVAAKLLERRQNELRAEKYGDTDMMEDKDSIGSDQMIPPGLPAFQSLLMDFLDNQAPVLDENPTEENKQAFRNLIHLFSELIRHDVFSHDAYMCTLISRGDLLSSPAVMMPSADSVDLPSIKSQNESIKHEHQDDIKVDMDIGALVDTDFNSLYGSVKDEQKSSPEPPASVKSVKSEKDHTLQHSDALPTVTAPKGPSRHMLFATHFPIPQDEYSNHECNQRLIVLYGVGKPRDEARHVLKKISKEVVKLYSKRNCIDVSSGDLGKVKKKKEKEGEATAAASVSVVLPNYEGIFQKFQKLSYYDQHSVTEQCCAAVIEQINSFVSGSSSYLPLVDNISYLFDLMEYSLNINGLIEFICQMLKEMTEVELQLRKNKSSLAGTFTTSLGLCIVSVLRQYHTYLLVSQDLTSQAFEYLFLLWKTVESSNPGECMSAKRCIISYLCDVYSACAFLKSRFSEMFSTAHSQVKQTIHVSVTPSASNLRWDPAFMIELISTGKSQPDLQVVKQLSENPPNRYSFVCNATLNICNSQVPERLNEISLLCAELTARCNPLSSEWLGVLKALCCSSMHSSGFIDVLTQIDVSDLSIHDSLAVFTAILIARQCFSLQDLVVHVALPSLLAACPSAGGDQDAEPGARLTCHLLLRLFKTHDLVLPQPTYGGGIRNPPMIKASCDRHLLEASHDSITIGPVMAVLKAMLVMGDSCNDESKSKSASNSNHKDKGDDIIQTLLRGLDDDVDMDMVLGAPSKSTKTGMESAGLSEFSKHALKEMCDQTWVQEKFLKDPERLFDGDTLIDPMLTNKQAQQLLQMICYPKGVPNQVEGSEPDNKQVILRILETLDQWSLRVSWLEVQLMFKQATTQTETNNILDNIAKGTIDLFHQQTEYSKSSAGSASPQETNKLEVDKDSVWLVAPLISKLPNTIQGRVLKLAGQVLESGNDFVTMKSKMDKEKNQKSKSLLGHQPFLSLVLTCLKGQDEQREGLLNSLHSQLEKFINNTRELLDKYPDETKIRQNIHESLQLRLSLVGGMFDTIQRNNTNTTDWAMLLVQLISHDVVDIQTNNELFMTIIDMLSVLIHGTLLPDGSDKTDDNTKTYNILTKKLRREIADKHTDCTDSLRLLLPLHKKMYEVITCESHGNLVDSKGNKITGFDSIGKKQGLQVAQKVLISPWDVIEGYKNPAPISWSYFSAVRLERKPLKYEDQHRLLLYHTHSMKRPNSYYLEPPSLPPEDLEPPPEKVEEKLIDKNESNNQESVKKQKSQRRRRQPKPSAIQPPVRPYPYQETMYQPSGPHPTWMTPPQAQPSYGYSSQPMPGPGDYPNRQRFPGNASSSKFILNSMLRNRSTHPQQAQYGMQQNPMNPMMIQKHQQHQYIRQQILQKQRMYNNNTSMHGSSMQPMPGMPQNYPGAPYGSMQQQQAPQQQGPSRMMDSIGGNMMQSYNQQYQDSGNTPGMMQPGMQQQGYIAQQPMQQAQPQYAPQRMQPPMGNMNTGMGSMSGYNQMGPAAPQQQQSSYMTPQQQQRYQQIRQQQQQQMMQMQQQQPQPQMSQSAIPTQQQQATAALVAQLQRQMSGGNSMQGQQGQQYQQQYQQQYPV